MTLTKQIAARIASDGPIAVSTYMSECLFHPTLGYYSTQEPFGRGGDFVTAPEMSQMFGELIGLCLAQAWIDQGHPPRFTLAELGPGRGTLMADVLRATKAVDGFAQAADIIMIEASDRLTAVQKQTLSDTDARWVEDVDGLPDQPLYAIANEFFDALPIRQFLRAGSGWRERQIGLSDQKLAFGLGPVAPHARLEHRLADTKDGDLVEYAPALSQISASLGLKIDTYGGAGIIVDYGDWRSTGDTLQAVQNHAFSDVLSDAGSADLTAHVDFEAIAQAVPCAHTRLTPQGIFLERLGITQRAQLLGKNLTGEALQQHIQAHRRLTHPEEMGTLFKVLGLFPTGKAAPAGLEI
ncbi:MAG: SAM-dependent methyltransferase [Roseobacter sp.]